MNFKTGCSAAVLMLFCFGDAHTGALKNKFLGSKQMANQAQSDVSSGENASQENPEISSEKGTSAAAADDVSTPNTSETKKIEGDPVVLRINGKKEYRRSQILDDMKLVPPQMIQNMQPDKLFISLRDQKLNAYLMLEQAIKAGMDKTEDFLKRMENMKREMLVREFLMKELGPKVENESVVKQRYDKYLKEFKKGFEYKLCHIMLDSEKDVKDVLALLSNGNDFAKLAKEKSKAASKENGGDEGFISINHLPNNLKEKIAPLKDGDYTKEAVQIESRYHLFKVTERRDTKPLTFEEAQNMLKQRIMYEEMAKLSNKLEKQAKVEKFNEDGSPVVASPAGTPTE